MDNNRTYLSAMTKEEVAKLIQYPSELWQTIYNAVEESVSWYVQDTTETILGKDWQKWVKLETWAYGWLMNIKEGQYANILDITEYDYFAEHDAERLKALQTDIKMLCDKIDGLSSDDVNYYDKLYYWEDEADELANEALKIVAEELHSLETITDDQLVDEFVDCEWGVDYYILNNDKSVVYKDEIKVYKTHYKEKQ